MITTTSRKPFRIRNSGVSSVWPLLLEPHRNQREKVLNLLQGAEGRPGDSTCERWLSQSSPGLPWGIGRARDSLSRANRWTAPDWEVAPWVPTPAPALTPPPASIFPLCTVWLRACRREKVHPEDVFAIPRGRTATLMGLPGRKPLPSCLSRMSRPVNL